MVTTGNKRVALLCVGLVISLVMSVLVVGAQAQEPLQEDGMPNKVFLPLIAGTAADSATEQAPLDQEPAEGLVVEVSTVKAASLAEMPAPVGKVQLAWTNEPPVLSEAQVAQLEYWLARTHLPGPLPKQGELAPVGGPPAADTMSAVLAQEVRVVGAGEEDVEVGVQASQLQAAGDAVLFRNVAPVTTSGTKSNVLEASVAEGGKNAFFTGNWFAARSTNGGATWTYVNPYGDMPDFCCDQVAIYDKARDMILWSRLGVPNGSGVNKYRLGASINGGSSFCNYELTPTNVNSSWTNQKWDYPRLQLGADYVYIAINLFNASDQWTRTVLLRWPLDSLRACAGFGYSYYPDTAWFTFVPVQGADHIMYFASNFPTTSPFNRINIWTWSESSTSLSSTTKTVTAWSFTNRGEAVCGSSSGNWAARTDDRLLTSARYMIHGNNLQVPGRKVIAWWWNVKQGGGFPQPYIEAAAFYEDTLAQVSGNQGRPLIWNSSTCYLYPSAAANARGDLGIVLHYSSGTNKNPSIAFAIADDYVSTPPTFALFNVKTSNARPADNKWGDYNTVRPFYPTAKTWVAGSHYIPGSSNCTNCGSPVFFVFGRDRDRQSWNRWQKK